ncbi:TetR/AcrR family transcriptional regulator [Thalassospira australica]|uniref:TetR/AcrR family transcriptional regulator n=1 Tax=Thalassospira australica TaxID=1528106 RepID=UPI00384E8E6F
MRRSVEKHRAILDAAGRLVVAQGYHSTSIDAVAAEAGCGKQTIYRWWPSKADLFVEVYDDLVDRDVLTKAFHRHDASLETGLAALLEQLFRFYETTPAGRILSGLIGEAAQNEAIRNALRTGLVIGRAPIVVDLVSAFKTANAGPGTVSAAAVNETIVALVWKRLVMHEVLGSDAAREIACLAVAAGRDGGGRER